MLRGIKPQVHRLPAGAWLARVYFAGGDHPTHWSRFRSFGPTQARFDHQLPDAAGAACEQTRSILYAAADGRTCLAEVFQDTRRIDRARNAPQLAVFRTRTALDLLDLTGSFTTRCGASMALNSGPRSRARPWAQAFYEAYPELLGLYYGSSMHGNAPAMALTDRAAALDPFRADPEFDRALADDRLLPLLKNAAADVGYALR